MEIEAKIAAYLVHAGWTEPAPVVEFLAAGEYNENYLVTDGLGEKSVFRINHGTQLGLKNQIEYEFNVLKAIEPSGVTPRAFYFDNAPQGLDGGVLLMEYVPGRPLEYKKDISAAAGIFARIHNLPVSPLLIVQPNPILDIAEESFSLLNRYADHPLGREKKLLFDYHDKISLLGSDNRKTFQNEAMCIVNTEVNSHNFLIHADSGYLVDWEKAVVSYRYQDLGHFLVPTTTLWRGDYVYSPEEKKLFLNHYNTLMSPPVPFEELMHKTALLEKTILLRGLSWCFMAYYEYTQMDRSLKNTETFKQIKGYLDRIEWFLKP